MSFWYVPKYDTKGFFRLKLNARKRVKQIQTKSYSLTAFHFEIGQFYLFGFIILLTQSYIIKSCNLILNNFSQNLFLKSEIVS